MEPNRMNSLRLSAGIPGIQSWEASQPMPGGAMGSEPGGYGGGGVGGGAGVRLLGGDIRSDKYAYAYEQQKQGVPSQMRGDGGEAAYYQQQQPQAMDRGHAAQVM